MKARKEFLYILCPLTLLIAFSAITVIFLFFSAQHKRRLEKAQQGYLYIYWKYQKAKFSWDGKYYQNINEMPKIFWDALQCNAPIDDYCINIIKSGIKLYENKAEYEKKYPDYPVDFDIQVKPDSFTVISVINIDKDKDISVWVINDNLGGWRVYNDLGD